MSSPYPVLNNRPIDQWKVTELKEELRRRKLPISGLKENLIRRLSEALDDEQQEAAANDGALDDGINPGSDQQGDAEGVANDEATNLQKENPQVAIDRNKKLDNDNPEVVEGVSSENVNQNTKIEDETETKVEDVQDPVTVKTVEDPVSVKTVDDSPVPVEYDGAATNLITKDERSGVNDDIPEPISESMKDDDAEPIIENMKSSPLELNDRVSEITTDLGFQEKCGSLSADSVSINENNELKDSLSADNFPIEIDPNSETMQLSSRNTLPITGDELKLNKEPGENLVSLPEIDVTNPSYVNLSKKCDNDDGGSPEKLNLDRSSGDESMEEDVLDKHVDFSNNLDEMEKRSEINKVHVVEEKAIGDIMVDELSSKNVVEEEMKPAASAEKRKLEEPESVHTNEAPKKQRRWNSETIKVPKIEIPMLFSSGAPKDTALTTPRRIFSRSNSGASADTPKERVVPPSQKAATTSLRIDCFLRPFTLKAVQELLANTGTVSAFWMDNIKTHCYVTYSSVEEAIATRNALYNLQWPPNGGRQLIANFVEAEEVKALLEGAPAQTPAPITPSPTTPSTYAIQNTQPSPQPHQQPPQPSNLPPPPPPPHQNNVVSTKERLGPPLPPEKEELPPVTLDDLFKKTKATPRIYYLPLSEGQVAAKLAAQGHRKKIN